MAASAGIPASAANRRTSSAGLKCPLQPEESAVLEQPDDEARPPAPAPQKPGVVEQAEVEASPPEPTLDPAAASPEPDTIKLMPEEWRAPPPISCSLSPAAGRSCRRPSRSRSLGPEEDRTSRQPGR